jgi:hypothetical protein
LCARSRKTSCWQYWRIEGNSPERLLLLKLRLRILRVVIFVVDVSMEQSGLGPVSIFWEISNRSNDPNLHKEDGMLPEMELSNRKCY